MQKIEREWFYGVRKRPKLILRKAGSDGGTCNLCGVHVVAVRLRFYFEGARQLRDFSEDEQLLSLLATGEGQCLGKARDNVWAKLGAMFG